MNYFEDHIGDYAAATAHLTWDEDMAYTRLIRAYYHSEKPIPKAQAYRLARAATPGQRKAVDTVLAEFFTLADDGFHQKRCDEEIARFQDKQAKAKRSANARWNAKPTQSDGNANASPNAMRTHMPTHSEGNALQSPDTKHQAPEQRASLAGQVCKGLRQVGFSSTNPSDPRLIALLDAGATEGEIVAVGEEAAKGGKGWPWLLAVVQARRKDAASIGALPEKTTEAKPWDTAV